MANEIQTVEIGGVKYDKNEVANYSEVAKERTNSKGLWEQYREYNVTLKDGTELKYEYQSAIRKATVDILEDGSINFYGLSKAKIQDTKKDDIYRLMGCEFTHIEARRDSFFNERGADKDSLYGYHRELENGEIQESHGNTAQR